MSAASASAISLLKLRAGGLAVGFGNGGEGADVHPFLVGFGLHLALPPGNRFCQCFPSLSKLCPPNTDVTVSAIYKCHSSVGGVGRRAGAEPLA